MIETDALSQTENKQAETDVQAGLDTAMQILAELKDYFARLRTVGADTSGTTCPDASATRYHELDV